MKKKIIAGILCFIVIAVAAAPLFTAGDTGKTYSQKATDLFSKGLGKALTGITGGLNSLMNENSSFILIIHSFYPIYSFLYFLPHNRQSIENPFH